MRFNFVTLFPEKIESYFSTGIPGKARERGIVQINAVHLRDFAGNKHHKVDDTIYGGGPGMLLQVGPVFRALESLGEEKGEVILLSPSGALFNQDLAREIYASNQAITLVSGYYEGVDHRVTEHLVDREVAIGNYVISSGDLASLVVADCISRLVPGFLGKQESLVEESHNEEDQLEYPQFTKPFEFNGWTVPDVLVNGNHEEIRKWREKNRKKRNHP
ncbi:fused tRNA (guanine-N(1)-)-methyltransferase/unknown domain-containing protein [Leptospira ryugenii]|uniref:tRNA (guanine-N(1)-)-methyltransferase n=1 Tax=Leptospira ryugenii TaxID=1917863 RepID=A0A2P2DWW1_9LEPT|nr:tRNA (guanosine(37)-N1)-methyltransferase TrmD [Leptospira ryugenii]GBF49060.1 fused tRNA (guanine-N(1)-)-methyltransferase/unknown domain-containing protein [Leptospira ryugenii]